MSLKGCVCIYLQSQMQAFSICEVTDNELFLYINNNKKLRQCCCMEFSVRRKSMMNVLCWNVICVSGLTKD